MKFVTTIDELRKLAKKKVPKMFYDYMESGSWTESTLKANIKDFKKIKFRQRVAVDISNRNVSKMMLGEKVKIPTALAPTGLTGMQYADGEILAAQAAEEFGIPFTLSTMSICSIEDVANNTNSPFWFQLYVMKDHQFSKKLINRAKSAGCSALMLTIDLQIMGQRHKDLKNGLSSPPKITFKNIFDMSLRPKWCFNMLKTKRRSFGNIVGHVDGVSDTSKLTAWTKEQFDLKLNWDDVKRIKDWWGGKLILKGILDTEDALLASKAGADAIIVSNHGGRQLDCTISSISSLPDIKKNIGNNIEVWLDGGIRSGQDILKALAMGADSTLIGRAFLYGLAANGKEGVNKSLQILKNELDYTMALCGQKNIKNIDQKILQKNYFLK